jgi:hypothetical protein
MPGGGQDTPARRVLERLLRRAEAAALAGDPQPASLSMTGKRDAAEYRALRGMADFDAFHGRIALAERCGAITVERDRHRDDGERLLRLGVRDAAALAHDLGVELLHERVVRAEGLLVSWQASAPVVARVLAAWRGGGKVRGKGPDAAGDLAAAAQAVDTLLAAARSDQILRKASTRLFGDSKRLEALTPWLDLLVTGELFPSGLENGEIWAALGLRKEPQPLLLAGPGVIALDDGSGHVLPQRWLGFPVDAIGGITTGARALLSIENLASFHEAASSRGQAPVLLLYTGGMPSPAWRQAYVRLLAGLPDDAAVYHWGDIDRGGFRIAARLAEAASDGGRRLRPWLMAPDTLPAECRAAGQCPAPAVLATMCEWARRAGWPEVAAGLQRTPLLLEQERLPPFLPWADGAGMNPE